ncbi:MAG: carboxypeptidase-like regulatory domain-containing protein [SAR324 cluster bacterium]|nr:carboxypeptidase-like regulatory domain-containing protein [SAR324 cluster bacterium]
MHLNKKHSWLSIILLLFCVVLMPGCNKSGSEKSGSEQSSQLVSNVNSSASAVKVTGVAAGGVAQASSVVFLIDGNEQEEQVAVTNSEGKFSFQVTGYQNFPAILSVNRKNQTPLCSIIAEIPAILSEITAHVNPITDLVCRSVLGTDLPAALKRIVFSDGRVVSVQPRLRKIWNAGRSLGNLTAAEFQAAGEGIVIKVFGDGISFTTFSNDTSFQARSKNTTNSSNLPSVSDVLLDTLQELAANNEASLEEFLASELESSSSVPLLDQDEFMVELSSGLIGSGYDVQTSNQNLSKIVNRPEVVAAVNTVAIHMENVRKAAVAQGVEDSVQLEIILKGVSTAIVEVIKNQKITQNVSQLKDINAQALENATSNVIYSVQNSIIDVVKTNASLGSSTVLNSLVKTTAQQVSQLSSHVPITEVMDQKTLDNFQQASQSLIETTSVFLSDALGKTGGTLEGVLQNSQSELLAMVESQKQDFGQTIENVPSVAAPVQIVEEKPIEAPKSFSPSIVTPAGPVTTISTPSQNITSPSSSGGSSGFSGGGSSGSSGGGASSQSVSVPLPAVAQESVPVTTIIAPSTSTTFTTTTTTTVPPVGVQILKPATLITVGYSPILVSGAVDDTDVELTVNGIPVPLAGTTFQAAVSLEEGGNTIVARAYNAYTEATASILVSLDKTPPYITIDSLIEGQVVSTPNVMVSGLVNDIVRGTVSEDQANVVIISEHVDSISRQKRQLSASISAAVSNRSYLATEVPLQEGKNIITVSASDQVGNVNSTQMTIHYKPPESNHLELLSGQSQSGVIGAVLPQPFQVRLVDRNNIPLVGKKVVFRVVKGDGLVGVKSAEPSQAILQTTDSQGIASTFFQLGSRSGNGNQHVRVTGVGAEGEILFYASATPRVPEKISINSGNNQRGGVNQQLGQPFVVSVTDSGANVLKGIEVEFNVTAGGGKLQNGKTAFSLLTDSDGRASAHLTLGPEKGMDVHRVTATIAGSDLYAGFTASALQTGNPGNTRVSGLVLDNEDQPLPGVTVRVEGTTRQAITDEAGQFIIPEVPVGPLHLIADGSTTSLPGTWPTLSYNIITVPGADNPLSSPIYMLKLDTDNAKLIGEEDVAFTLPDVPGFKLIVPKGSATFPDGSKIGYLSVTVVNSSKIPMAPPNGMQPQFIITIQPTGTMFDPPAPLTLPNVDGHPPGAQPELYSYDHDLEEFVTIGLGKVSEDGQVIESLPGVGVIKAGWHCGSQPSTSGCVHQCTSCQICMGNCTCLPDFSKNGLEIGLYHVCFNGEKVKLTASQASGLQNIGFIKSTRLQQIGQQVLRAHWGKKESPEITQTRQDLRALRHALRIFKKAAENNDGHRRSLERLSNTRTSISALSEYQRSKTRVQEILSRLLRSPPINNQRSGSPASTNPVSRELRKKAREIALELDGTLEETTIDQLKDIDQLLKRLEPQPIVQEYQEDEPSGIIVPEAPPVPPDLNL